MRPDKGVVCSFTCTSTCQCLANWLAFIHWPTKGLGLISEMYLPGRSDTYRRLFNNPSSETISPMTLDQFSGSKCSRRSKLSQHPHLQRRWARNCCVFIQTIQICLSHWAFNCYTHTYFTVSMCVCVCVCVRLCRIHVQESEVNRRWCVWSHSQGQTASPGREIKKQPLPQRRWKQWPGQGLSVTAACVCMRMLIFLCVFIHLLKEQKINFCPHFYVFTTV